MARQNITDRFLRSLKSAPKGTRYEVFDTVVPSFGIRVTDKGKRSFFLLARYPGSSNPTRRTIGEYPAMELAPARSKAREWLELLGKRIDPQQVIVERSRAQATLEAAKNERAFETVLDRYIKTRRRDGIRKVDDDERDFNRECLPVWRGKPVDEITMTDILAVVQVIHDRGATRQALNMGQKIGTFLNWCADDELIPASPYRPKRVKIAIGERQSRDRVLTDDEIKAFWLSSADLGEVYRDVYRVLLLTGQRLNDIARASWSEIDLEKETLTIPADRFKSDRDHVVPLTPDVLAIIKAVKRWKKCPWVFSLDGIGAVTMGDKVKGRLDAKMLETLRKSTGNPDTVIAPWVNHDLRRTVRTRLSELDVLDEIAEIVIGHMPTKLNRTYNHSERLRVKLEALTTWEGALRAIVEEKTTK
jgi:integrase